MKKLLFVLLLLPSVASAQKFDLDPFLNDLSVCSIITHKGDVMAGGCYRAFSFRDYGSLNGGVLWDTNSAGDSVSRPGVGGAALALGVRADKAFGWLWRKSGLEAKGAKVHFAIPKVEIGPSGGYHTRVGFFYGGFLNGRWPFGG